MDFPTILGFLAIISRRDGVFESETERLVCGRLAPPPTHPALVSGTAGSGVAGRGQGGRGRMLTGLHQSRAWEQTGSTLRAPYPSPQGRVVPWRPPHPPAAILRPGGVLISCKETETKRFAET